MHHFAGVSALTTLLFAFTILGILIIAASKEK